MKCAKPRARAGRACASTCQGSLKIIAQRIGAQDTVIPCGDGFLVVFADAACAETERCCGEIRDALIRFYLGEEA